jgi:tripartite-type tricarboxylate transporter receptor subunit TctC
MAPANTPKALIAKLNADTNRALKEPDLHDKLVAGFYQPIGGTPEQFGELVRTEVERYGKIIRAVGIKPN